jgi:hypothetical protein
MTELPLQSDRNAFRDLEVFTPQGNRVWQGVRSLAPVGSPKRETRPEVFLQVRSRELPFLPNGQGTNRVAERIGDSRIVSERTEIEDGASKALCPLDGSTKVTNENSEVAWILRLNGSPCPPGCARCSRDRLTDPSVWSLELAIRLENDLSLTSLEANPSCMNCFLPHLGKQLHMRKARIMNASAAKQLIKQVIAVRCPGSSQQLIK